MKHGFELKQPALGCSRTPGPGPFRLRHSAQTAHSCKPSQAHQLPETPPPVLPGAIIDRTGPNQRFSDFHELDDRRKIEMKSGHGSGPLLHSDWKYLIQSARHASGQFRQDFSMKREYI
jgi:hypothetical protein